MSFDFAAASEPTPTGEAGEYTIDLDPNWTILDKPNGGYVLAVLGRCAGLALDAQGSPHRHPISSSATFAAAPSIGPATIAVNVLRSGRSVAQVEARLFQDGPPLVTATFTFSTLTKDSEIRYGEPVDISLADPSQCIELLPVNPSGAPVKVLGGTREAVDPETAGFTRGVVGEVAEIRAWVSFRDDQPHDPFTLLYVIDCLPPATFNIGSLGWVPTLSLQCYVRALPAPGPLRVRQRATLIADGIVDEVCEVVDSTGRLVAHGGQLALVRFPA